MKKTNAAQCGFEPHTTNAGDAPGPSMYYHYTTGVLPGKRLARVLYCLSGVKFTISIHANNEQDKASDKNFNKGVKRKNTFHKM